MLPSGTLRTATAWVLAIFILMLSASVEAQNFISSDSDLRQTAEAARERSARFWSSRPLPGRWSRPCPIEWRQQTGAGSGLTCFQIQGGEVFGWRMTLRGNRDAVLNDVIPHEVDHAVRASLCRRPLPRWIDEGCASLFESESSHEQLRSLRRTAHQSFLTSVTLDSLSYPGSSCETQQLYAEGFSLVEFLLERGTPQDLLRIQRSTAPPSQSLVQVYRIELPQLFSEWQKWEQQRLRSGVRCDCVNCPRHRPRGGSSPPLPTQPLSPSTADTHRSVLVIWTADWCPPCQQFHRDLASNASFRAQLESKFQWVERDFDQSSVEAERAGVNSVPAFVALDRQIKGYLGPEWLLEQLGISKETSPATVPSLQETVPPPQEPIAPTLITPATKGNAEIAPAGSVSPADPPVSPLLPLPPVASQPAGFWPQILSLAPTIVTVLTSLGVIGGTAATGGAGGVALMLLLKLFSRRATRNASGKSPPKEGGVAPVARAPFPRQLDEASELLGLRRSEGRVATLDALRGMFLDDELDKFKSDPDPSRAELVRQIRAAVNTRVDEVAPLTTKG